MGIDNYTLNRIFNEIKDKILFSKIERILNISDTTFIFSLFKDGKCLDLLLSLDPSLPLILTSSNSKIYSVNPSNYATNMLRKFFDYGTITNLEKIKDDRIIIFQIKKWTASYQLIESKLIFEMFPLSPNIIITDLSNKILDAFKRSESLESKHLVYKGLTYTFPFATNKDFTSTSPLEELKGKVNRSEFNYLASLAKEDYQAVLKKMFSETNYYLYKKDLSSIKISNESKIVTLEELFNLVKDQKVYENKENKHQNLFKLVEQKKKSLAKKLINLESDNNRFIQGEKYKEFGNLLFLGSNDYQKGDQEIIINETKIPLDSRLDLTENAQKYFKLYKKSKSGIEQIKLQKEKTKEELDYFEKISKQLKYAQENDIQEIILDLCENHYIKEHKVQKQLKNRPKNKKFTPHFIKCSNGTKIGYGLSSFQNEELTFSLAHKDDFYFHVKDFHGPHVIIFSASPSKEEILLAAEISCYFADVSSGEVQYTQKKYVKKVPGKRGLAILSQYKILMVKEISESTKKLLSN